MQQLKKFFWEVWTTPERIQHWWGPDGFTSIIEKMQVEPGCEWIFVMHGPNGKTYPDKTFSGNLLCIKR